MALLWNRKLNCGIKTEKENVKFKKKRIKKNIFKYIIWATLRKYSIFEKITSFITKKIILKISKKRKEEN